VPTYGISVFMVIGGFGEFGEGQWNLPREINGMKYEADNLLSRWFPFI